LGHWGIDLVAATFLAKSQGSKLAQNPFVMTADIRQQFQRFKLVSLSMSSSVGSVTPTLQPSWMVYAYFLPSADKLAADSAVSVIDHATSEGGNRFRTD